MRLVVELPEDLHRRIKVRAAEEGRTISQMVRGMIELELSKTARWEDKGKTFITQPAPTTTIAVAAPETPRPKPPPAPYVRPKMDLSKGTQAKGKMGR